MRVIFDSRFVDGSPSGIGSYCLALLEGLLAHHDREIEILALVQADGAKQVEPTGVKTVNVDYAPRSLRNQLQLPRYGK